jgi:hypothetical protein
MRRYLIRGLKRIKPRLLASQRQPAERTSDRCWEAMADRQVHSDLENRSRSDLGFAKIKFQTIPQEYV